MKGREGRVSVKWVPSVRDFLNKVMTARYMVNGPSCPVSLSTVLEDYCYIQYVCQANL